MSQIKQILQFRQNGFSIKKTAKSLGISKNTVKNFLHRFDSLGMSLHEALEAENPILEDHIRGICVVEKDNYQTFLDRAEYYADELSTHKHLTRLVLWEEDFKAGLAKYKYSRFCHHLNQYLKSKQPSMVLNHKPGDKVFVDFAGINFT